MPPILSIRKLRGLPCVLAALAIGSVTHSQSSPPLDAKLLAQRIDAHYNRLHSLRAAFTERYQGLGTNRTESGTMLLQKPGKMRWEYTTTPGKLFVLDGKFAWFYSPGQSQVQRIAATQLDDLRSPLRFLLGHTKIESELEHLTVAPANQETFALSGIPKGQQKRIAKLLILATQDGRITGIEIDEIDGAQTKFSFSKEESNPTIPESSFHFTPPPGIPIVDALPPV